jgi:glycosyltransferase involved in cell wall biosynthesis
VSTARPVYHLVDANSDTAYFRAIARHHDGQRYPVAIGSLSPPGPLQQAMRELGVPTFSLDVTARRQYGRALVRLAHLLRRRSPAILHAHCFDPTLVGMLAARAAGAACVFTRHHSDHHLRLGKRWHTRIDAWCGRRADAVIAVSQATRRIMSEIERVPEDRITVVYNGMDPLPAPPADRIERLRQELAVGSGAVCLVIARLHEEKGHAVLFEAIPAILARVGALLVLLAGDGPHRRALETEVRRRGIASVVRFLGQRSDIASLLALSTLVVLPSLAESFGFAALEAMSAGRPVLATRTGGLPELIVEGETGLLVAPGDAPALAAAACRILQDPAGADTLGRHGRRRAALFTSERMVRGYEQVYDRLGL